MFTPLNRKDLLRALLVCIATVVAGMVVYQLFDRPAWNTPAAYAIDSLEVLARLKLASEDGFGAWFSRCSALGAPFGADWSAYPQPDLLVYWLAGKASLLIGVFAASNLMLLGAHALASTSFFLSARLLGHRPLFAAAAGVLYGLSHFNFFRGLSHFSFTLSFILPPMLVAAWWVAASRRSLLGKKRLTFLAATVVLAGAGNPYYAYLFLHALAWALVFQFGTRRNRENLLVGCALVAGTILSVVAWNFPTLLGRLRDPFFIDPVVRNYAGTELYALKPIELFIPPGGHRLKALSDLGTDYTYSTTLRGETFGPYLGIIAIAALVWMFTAVLRRALISRASLRPAYAPLTLWLVLLGAVGGLQAFAAINGFYVFRASNRYSIAIAVCALLFLTSTLSKSRRLSAQPKLAWLLAVLLLAVGLWDQTPAIRTAAAQQPIRDAVAHDAAFAAELQRALPARAMVFQLPAVGFPEQPRVVDMSDYALFRPYLHTRDLRFSYGSLLSSREFLWARRVASAPAAEMINALEAAGFTALYLNRTAFKDRAEQLLNTLATLGYTPIPSPSSEHVALKLHPRPQPSPPDLSAPANLPAWKPYDSATHRLYAEAGWFELEQTPDRAWRWFGEQALLALDNPATTPKTLTLSFEFHALSSGRLQLTQHGRTVWETRATRKKTSATVRLEFAPGAHHLLWRYEGDLVPAGRGDPRQLGVCIINLSAVPAE